jgi:hypothetical protein
MPATTTWGTGPSVRDVDEKRRDFRLMCFAASLALLVLLATPSLTTDTSGLGRGSRLLRGAV